ncbi:hypothetical protein TNIN_370931 [Trichonephila inaurata madagascariensis]|uniref:Secreted protein n=1 Tax=Trichonephila inaurata madagascariensis TaxID=2747483 RepID=A0A8X6MFL0_9ARAC|nr:hypothetical protein TNIN_370931 [Trichonephila inaurata madagascariensis]
MLTLAVFLLSVIRILFPRSLHPDPPRRAIVWRRRSSPSSRRLSDKACGSKSSEIRKPVDTVIRYAVSPVVVKTRNADDLPIVPL